MSNTQGDNNMSQELVDIMQSIDDRLEEISIYKADPAMVEALRSVATALGHISEMIDALDARVDALEG